MAAWTARLFLEPRQRILTMCAPWAPTTWISHSPRLSRLAKQGIYDLPYLPITSPTSPSSRPQTCLLQRVDAEQRFGQIFSTVNMPRQFQFGSRFTF